MKSDMIFLQENRIFSGLFNGDIDKLLGVAEPGRATRKQMIYKPNDPADSIYFIKSGHVKVYKMTEEDREIAVGIYQAGDVFGEMAFMENKPRSYFAEALDDTLYIKIKRTSLFSIAKKKPGIIYRMGKLVGERRREIERQMESLLFKGVRERLAGQLLKLSRQYGIEDNRGKLLRIKITHKDIASLIGSSRETVSLTLAELRRMGLIDVNADRKIIIRDETKLTKIA